MLLEYLQLCVIKQIEKKYTSYVDSIETHRLNRVCVFTSKVRILKAYFRLVVFTLISITMLTITFSVSAEPQRGDQLNRASNLNASIVGGIFSAITGEGLEGKVNTVTVNRVSENEITLALDFEGFADSTIKAYAADHEGKEIRSILRSQHKVSGDHAASSENFQLSLNTSQQLEEGLQTSLVVFSISKPNSPAVPLRLLSFHLNKDWSHEVSPNNIVVAVRPTPIGRTAEKVSNTKAGLQSAVLPMVQTSPVKIEQVEQARRRFNNLQIKPTSSTLFDSKHTQLRSVLGDTAKSGGTTPVAVARQTTQVETYTVSKSSAVANVIKALPSTIDYSKIMVPMDLSKFEIVKPQESPNSTEPTNQVTRNAVRWYDVITESGVSIDLRDVLGIYNIYQDSNTNSGAYYFVPKNYGLSYNSDYDGAEGLGLRISYDRADLGQPVEDSSIRVAMTLSSGLDSSGVDLAKRILERLDSHDPNFKFTNLDPLPTGGPVSFDFSTGLFNIVDPESIVVLSYSDVLEDISVSFASDELEAERVRTNLEDPFLGIPGEVIFPLPSLGDDATAEIIPARVNLAEPKAYKALQWSADGMIRNNSPLSLKVGRIHMLDIDYGLGPIVYSWDLGNVSLPPRSQLELDMQDLPADLMTEGEHIWFEYDFDPACGDCLASLVDDVVIANVMKERSDLSLKFISPFACHDSYGLKIDVRSHFFDPNERELINGETVYVEATQDLAGFFPLGSVFLDGEDASEEDQALPYFEYRLTEIMSSGDSVESSHWLPYSGEILFLGTSQVGQSFPDMPCIETAQEEPIDSEVSEESEG